MLAVRLKFYAGGGLNTGSNQDRITLNNIKNLIGGERITLPNVQPTIIDVKEQLLVTMLPRWLTLPRSRNRPVLETKSPIESWIRSVTKFLDELDEEPTLDSGDEAQRLVA